MVAVVMDVAGRLVVKVVPVRRRRKWLYLLRLVYWKHRRFLDEAVASRPEVRILVVVEKKN